MPPPPERFVYIPPSSSAFSLSTLERNTRLAADLIVKGLKVAPNRSPNAPCVVTLPFRLHGLIDSALAAGERRSMSMATFLRIEHGKLLDSIVAFANSTWTIEDKELFESCHCRHHERGELKAFQFITYRQSRGHCSGYGPFHETILDVFMIIGEVAGDIRANQEDAIRLERKRKHGKWPSSPSKFLPKGAPAAVEAFMAWARMIDNPMPLQALSQLSFICPSLERIMSQNEELLPLIAPLFSEFTRSVKKIHEEGLASFRRGALEQDIIGFFHVMNETWFHDQMVIAKTNETIASAFTSIYTDICDLLPLVDLCVTPICPVHQVKSRFGSTGVAIHVHLTEKSLGPLHPVLHPHSQSSRGIQAGITAVATDVVFLRNQAKCAHLPCTETSESTKKNFKLCSACQAVRYCSKTCQAQDWKEHKLACMQLKVLLPLAFSHLVLDPSEPLEELIDRFAGGIEDGGLTSNDISSVREYVHSHIGRGGQKNKSIQPG